jgi:hypothetical protein
MCCTKPNVQNENLIKQTNFLMDKDSQQDKMPCPGARRDPGSISGLTEETSGTSPPRTTHLKRNFEVGVLVGDGAVLGRLVISYHLLYFFGITLGDPKDD